VLLDTRGVCYFRNVAGAERLLCAPPHTTEQESTRESEPHHDQERSRQGDVGREGHGVPGGPGCDTGRGVRGGYDGARVNSATKVANLNADRVDDREASSFANATHTHSGANITSGTVADARIASTIARDNEVTDTVKANDGTGSGLDADRIDGKDSSELEPRGYAQVTTSSPFFSSATSKGVIGITRPATGLYCFDLSFTPKAAVASGHINNNTTIGTVLGSGVPLGCTGEFRDTAAKTYAANDPASGVSNDWPFGIVFM
jgi:hypothetical protein